jgi:hypothetical protein
MESFVSTLVSTDPTYAANRDTMQIVNVTTVDEAVASAGARGNPKRRFP